MDGIVSQLFGQIVRLLDRQWAAYLAAVSVNRLDNVSISLSCCRSYLISGSQNYALHRASLEQNYIQ
jgi:hypothetical protein